MPSKEEMQQTAAVAIQSIDRPKRGFLCSRHGVGRGADPMVGYVTLLRLSVMLRYELSRPTAVLYKWRRCRLMRLRLRLGYRQRRQVAEDVSAEDPRAQSGAGGTRRGDSGQGDVSERACVSNGRLRGRGGQDVDRWTGGRCGRSREEQRLYVRCVRVHSRRRRRLSSVWSSAQTHTDVNAAFQPFRRACPEKDGGSVSGLGR